MDDANSPSSLPSSSANPRPWVILILGMAGVGLSWALTQIYLDPVAHGGSCTINEYMNCTAVSKSAYSTVAGLPLAAYGLVFYSVVVIATLQALVWNNDDGKDKPVLGTFDYFSLMATMGTLATGISILLAVISVNLIQKLCLFCVILYGINVLLFVAAKNKTPYLSHWECFGENLMRYVTHPVRSVVTALIVVGLAYWGHHTFAAAGHNPATPDDPAVAHENPIPFGPSVGQYNPLFEITSRIADPAYTVGNTLGNKDAEIVLHEYTDYQCPYCAVMTATLVRLVEDVDNVKIVHHDFPLSKDCNPAMQTNMHQAACVASRYGLAAKRQGKAWDLSLRMFLNQEQLSEEVILQQAQSIGLDLDQLKEDANSEAVQRELAAEVQEGLELKIEATPTIRIGNVVHSGMLPYPDLVEWAKTGTPPESIKNEVQ